MFRNIVLMLLLFITTVTAKDCLAKYRDEIVKGNAEAFKQYMIECDDNIDYQTMKSYEENSYLFLLPESVMCLGDYFSHGAHTYAAFDQYKLAAQMGNEDAKVSLGTIVSRDRRFIDRPNLDEKLKEEYIALAKDYGRFNFQRFHSDLERQHLSGDEEKAYLEAHEEELMTHAQKCVGALDTDIRIVASNLQKTEEKSSNLGWAITEGLVLKNRKRQLEYAREMFLESMNHTHE